MIIGYILALCTILISIALAGIATDRHLIAIMLAVELIFLSSTVALLTFLSSNQNADSSGIMLLLSIWSVAAVEIIALIAFCVYIKGSGFSFDVSKLSKMRW